LLPDGQRVRRVTPTLTNGFAEVETTLHGGLFHGFAAAQFLVPVTESLATPRAVMRAAAAPRETGVVAVFAPRAEGSVGAHRRLTICVR
jgi:hypothetical protein